MAPDFDFFANQNAQPGKLVEVELFEYQPSPFAGGKRPIVILEHIGDFNETLIEEQLQEAIADSKKKPDELAAEVARNMGPPSRERREKNFEFIRDRLIKHGIRGLKNVYSDSGREATADDIKAFVMSWSRPVVRRISRMAADDELFVATAKVDPEAAKTTAEK